MAALEELFGLYYGSVDSTPLFYSCRRLLDEDRRRHLIRELWPGIQKLRSKYGDLTGVGF
jgi:glycogen debranching enzyme